MAYLAYRDNLVACTQKGEVKTSIVLDAETDARLKHISEKTMIPMARLPRKAID